MHTQEMRTGMTMVLAAGMTGGWSGTELPRWPAVDQVLVRSAGESALLLDVGVRRVMAPPSLAIGECVTVVRHLWLSQVAPSLASARWNILRLAWSVFPEIARKVRHAALREASVRRTTPS
jgi:hypothetical protein